METPFYYLNQDNQPVGPMDLSGIRHLVDAGVVPSSVRVCRSGSENWSTLSDMERAEPITATPDSPQRKPATSGHAANGHTPEPEPAAALNWLPLTSLIVGIVAVLTAFVPVLSLLLAIPALVSGILVVQSGTHREKPMALGGIATGGLSILLSLGGLILGGGSSANVEAAAMEQALRDGLEIGQEAQRKFSNDTVKQTRYIAAELQKVDTRKCPPDFRIAYQRNVEAWETAIPYFEANNPLTSFLEGLYGGLSNDYSAVGATNYQARLAAQRIDETYQQLKLTAVAYGASIPSR